MELSLHLGSSVCNLSVAQPCPVNRALIMEEAYVSVVSQTNASDV
jgi:hypothetical protein